MAYSSVSRLRELTNFTPNLISGSEVRVLIPLADRILNRLITSRHHLETMSGTIDGSNKLFRVVHAPIADMNYGNITSIDNCETANWTESTDATADAVNVTTFSEGSGSISIGKDGTASASINYYKTQSATAVGTAKYLYVDVWIKEIQDLKKTEAIEIRYGSDSSNYYFKTWQRDDLEDGWNTLEMEIADAGSSGSPAVATLDYCYIEVNTTASSTTITAGDIVMDYWRLEDPATLDIEDVDVYYGTLDTDNELVYGSRQTLTAVNKREGRVTVSTAPTTTTAREGVFATYRSTVENIDYNLIKDAATYVLAHLCSFKIAGEAPDYGATEATFLRRDIAGAPDEWLRLAITTINLALGSQQVGLRNIQTGDVLEK